MPEEKKESFTFSDKIKSSKPAGSKSFAKSSSKIGRDGKPRQTLFERTRRDAPFFIAALVALLLLPFLYKYSGQSSEDSTLLTPGSEESMFDPERYGFDTAMIEDPDGQVAQLSGRSSFDLIRGFGNEEEDYGARDDFDFDASASSSARADYEAEGEYEAKRHASTQIDEEENITNIYKRRARAATRAAFRRTPVKSLNPASMRRASGGKAITPWGGSLKDAASKVKSSGPKEGPKPVSLQPLRAGGPARSSFGQGAAAAARKGLDNMGKANAVEALRDSYVKPVDTGRVGGLDLFSDGHFGGGGKLDHNINIAPGKEPWWWDMMKTRMQKEWEARFNYKWGWINWATDIAKNILKGLINCLITGDDGGDMGRMFGYGSAGGAKAAKCCGAGAEAWQTELAEIGASSLTESSCKNILRRKFGNAKYKEACGDEFWEKGSSASGGSGGFFKSRLECFGIRAGGYLSGDLGLNGAGGKNICEDMPYHYQAIPSGEARKWHIYTFVTARNYFPASLKGEFPVANLPKAGNLLCAEGSTGLNHTGATSQGVGYVAQEAGKHNAKGTDVVKQESTKRIERSSDKEELRSNTYEAAQESKAHSCVIYVQQTGTFDYEVFKNEIIDQFKALVKNKHKNYSDEKTEELAQEAFSHLDLLTVEAVAMKDNLAAGRGSSVHKLYDGLLPMMYWEFEDAYILHKGVTNRKNGHDNDISKKKYRVEGQDLYRAKECYFGDWRFECGPENSAEATLHFNSLTYKGGQWETDPTQKPSVNDIRVSALFHYLDNPNGEGSVEQDMIRPDTSKDGGFTFTYTFNKIITSNTAKKTTDEQVVKLEDGKTDMIGNIVWTAVRGTGSGKQVIEKVCPLNMSGDGNNIGGEDKECASSQESEECCRELMTKVGKVEGKDFKWDPSLPEGSRCAPIDPCPRGAETNEQCCKEKMGAGYLWRESPEPRCYKPDGVDHFDDPDDKRKEQDPPQVRKITRLAPVISWVPTSGSTNCRKEVNPAENPNESVFADCSKISGVVKNKNQNCGSQQPMMMDSQAAVQFVKDVVAKYNAQRNPNDLELSDKFYGNIYPTDGEFIDALYLAKKVGIQTVPASAVCELGRDFIRMSRDKHTREMKIGKPMPTAYASGEWKDNNSVFHNELGAFLAYIHLPSIFYPQQYFGAKSNNQGDYRFIVLKERFAPQVTWSKEKCRYSSGDRCKEYHHNNYNNIKPGQKQAKEAYEASLAPIQRKAVYPLAGLAAGKTFPTVGGGEGVAKGEQYINAISQLIRERSGFEAWQGNACVAYAGSMAPLKVTDVLNYVETVCEVGLDYKPSGSPGKQGGHGSADTNNTGNIGGEGNPS